jgi:hypothetical protein
MNMGFFKNLIDKFNRGCFYVVDEETLRRHLEQNLKFSLDNNLEASANLNIYINNEKHHIQIWNFSASNFKDEKVKGLIVYYDDLEFKTIDDLMKEKLNNLPKYFKIELIDSDDTFLNEYKKNHPELKEEDY